MRKPCLVCGTPSAGSRCPAHQAQYQAAVDERRGTPAERGYGAEHKRRALALRAQRRGCCLCGLPIDYDLRAPSPGAFSAHHLTGDKSGPLDAAHKVCNEREGKPQS